MKKNISPLAAFTLVEIMIVVGVIGLLAAIAVPNFFKARENARTKSCINNLRLIDQAKQQWAMELNRRNTATPRSSELYPYLGRPGSQTLPTCPSGGRYTIGPVNEIPTCDYTGNTNHALVN